MFENKVDNETITVGLTSFASRGYWAQEIIKKFLGDETYNELLNGAKIDPKLTIDVTFKEGEIVDLRYSCKTVTMFLMKLKIW